MSTPFTFAFANAASGSSSYTANVTASTAAGDTLLVGVSATSTSSAPTSVTDSKGNTYYLLETVTVAGFVVSVFQSQETTAALASGTDTITVHMAGTGSAVNIIGVDQAAQWSPDVPAIGIATGTSGTTQAAATGTREFAGETVLGFEFVSTVTPTWQSPAVLLKQESGSGAGFASAAYVTSGGTSPVTVTSTTGSSSPAWAVIAIPYFPGAVTPNANPAHQAARNGLPGDTTAVSHAAQIAQFLATHAITPIYAGTQIITPAGNVGYGIGSIDWLNLGTVDIDQPFQMPSGKTTIGRVALPLSPVGNGADVTVSLYTDSGGSPGTLITTVTVPAAHLLQLAAPDGLDSGPPLATAWSNTIRLNEMTISGWAVPSPASIGVNPASTSSGNYFVLSTSQNGTPLYFFTVAWPGGTAPGAVLPQPSVATGTDAGTLIATSSVLVYAGGYTGATLTTVTANVWSAGWTPDGGQLQAWSAQTALPHAVAAAAGASNPGTGTIYVIGGNDTTGFPVTNTWYAQVTNGQVGAWTAGPPLPVAEANMVAGVVNGWLIAAGGFSSSTGLTSTQTWFAPISASGVPGNWQAGPPVPASLNGGDGCACAVTSSGLAVITVPGPNAAMMTLTVTADGPGDWQTQNLGPSVIVDNPDLLPVGAFPTTPGNWQLLVLDPPSGLYSQSVMSSVPVISVPLPAAFLTPGSTYHIVLHQDNGDAADYVQAALDPEALPLAAQTRPNSGGSWTPLSGIYSLLASVFDQTPGGQPLHLWEDSGARVVTLVWASMSGALLGLIETTAFPAGAPEQVLCTVSQVAYNGAGLPAAVTQLA